KPRTGTGCARRRRDAPRARGDWNRAGELPHTGSNMSASLYLVATPIGNLEDITYRAVRTLKEVDLIACEDTRHTRHLLDHYGISKPTISYHEHNETGRAESSISKIVAGANVAIVSDAGTPLICDP